MSKYLKSKLYKAGLLSMVLSLLAFTVALAASGDLDTTFDGDGLVTTSFGLSDPVRYDRVYGIAIQPSGKIVVAGYSNLPSSASNQDFALTRYNVDGSLDNTFSGDGKLLTNFGGDDAAFDIAVQSNGKIIAAGQKFNSTNGLDDVALARYNSNGTLDTTFSGDGKVVTDFGGADNGSWGGLAIQSNGKIVVAGYMYSGTDYNFAVYRYNSNGTLDTTFSGDGIAIGNFGLGRQDYSTDLVLQSDGKIVIAGRTGDANGNNNNFAIVRLNPNGTADPTFSGDGRVTTNFGADDYAVGVALQADGKIVVVGQKSGYFVIVRYNTNGSLDTTFNGTGKRLFNFMPGGSSYASDVIVQTNGNILVLGGTNFGGDDDFALVRLNSNGNFDTTFSGDGKVTVDFGGQDDGYALALEPLDGKYVVGG